VPKIIKKGQSFFQATIDNVGDVFLTFLYILTLISLGLLFLGSAEADIG